MICVQSSSLKKKSGPKSLFTVHIELYQQRVTNRSFLNTKRNVIKDLNHCLSAKIEVMVTKKNYCLWSGGCRCVWGYSHCDRSSDSAINRIHFWWHYFWIRRCINNVRGLHQGSRHGGPLRPAVGWRPRDSGYHGHCGHLCRGKLCRDTDETLAEEIKVISTLYNNIQTLVFCLCVVWSGLVFWAVP
ncbi:uncharacterized protein LOC129924056 [Biomphalaria glabrata]|uniref:Uncharacterized protein LOC129924056 n=1 Tax=Biomphalaria glabrata TaxID=6526 RepID=A0A9W2ZFN3_BIOGL|nr:uncharacterized protein LOC129924056 [Biomphalaria glabrata]